MNRDFSYVMPEWLILMVGTCYNLYLDTREGNIYTSVNANPKKVVLLYAVTAFICGGVIAVGLTRQSNPNHTVFYFARTFLLTFVLVFVLTLILDRVVFMIGKRRIDKKTEDSDDDI